MHRLERTVRCGREAERVSTALYRFLELRLSNAGELAGHAEIVSEPSGQWERKRITLWSEAAARDFAEFLRVF